jgi:hypothetical protein
MEDANAVHDRWYWTEEVGVTGARPSAQLVQPGISSISSDANQPFRSAVSLAFPGSELHNTTAKDRFARLQTT